MDLIGWDIIAPGLSPELPANPTTEDDPRLNPLDVNESGVVAAADALMVINQLPRGTMTQQDRDDLDANRDGSVSAGDALMIINFLGSTTQASNAKRSDQLFSQLGQKPGDGDSDAVLRLLKADEGTDLLF